MKPVHCPVTALLLYIGASYHFGSQPATCVNQSDFKGSFIKRQVSVGAFQWGMAYLAFLLFALCFLPFLATSLELAGPTDKPKQLISLKLMGR